MYIRITKLVWADNSLKIKLTNKIHYGCPAFQENKWSRLFLSPYCCLFLFPLTCQIILKVIDSQVTHSHISKTAQFGRDKNLVQFNEQFLTENVFLA